MRPSRGHERRGACVLVVLVACGKPGAEKVCAHAAEVAPALDQNECLALLGNEQRNAPVQYEQIAKCLTDARNEGTVRGCLQADREIGIRMSRTTATDLLRASEGWRKKHASDQCPTPEILGAEKAIDPASHSTDAWGNPFKIMCEDAETIIWSAGPDKKEGTSDDIRIPLPT
jgi:hypothetical protein